jgi:hypothetical protein
LGRNRKITAQIRDEIRLLNGTSNKIKTIPAKKDITNAFKYPKFLLIAIKPTSPDNINATTTAPINEAYDSIGLWLVVYTLKCIVIIPLF